MIENYEPVRKPNVKKVEETSNTYTPVVDVASPNFKPSPTVFKLFDIDNDGNKVELPPTPDVMVEKYWSLELIQELVKNSNLYIEMRKK